MAKKSNSSKDENPCKAGGDTEHLQLCKEDNEVLKILLKSICNHAEGVNNIAPLIMHIFNRQRPPSCEVEKWGAKELEVTSTSKNGKGKLLATLGFCVGLNTFTAIFHFVNGHNVEIKLTLSQ